MLRDRSADAEPDEPTDDEVDVVAWGDDPAPRRRTFRLLDRVRADRRFPPLAVAGFGLVAVFGSLVSDWATLRIRGTGSDAGQFGPEELSVSVSTVGVGSGYLVGILGIVALTAVATFGTRSVRHNAQVAGMAGAGCLLLLLVAGTISLDSTLDWMFGFGPNVAVDVRYGLGLTLAYAGTAAMGLALYLTGRAGDVRSPAQIGGDAEKPGEPGEHPHPRRGWIEDEEPVRDVTVLPAPPFTGPDWRQQHPR
jgi:hypothetical protein